MKKNESRSVGKQPWECDTCAAGLRLNAGQRATQLEGAPYSSNVGTRSVSNKIYQRVLPYWKPYQKYIYLEKYGGYWSECFW